MKLNKFLYLLLGVSLLVSGMAAVAAPAPVDATLYDYTDTYTMTEGFDVATSTLTTSESAEKAYSNLVKLSVLNLMRLPICMWQMESLFPTIRTMCTAFPS